jgi:KDO2-lipid IV(A) lauroyltransferase
MMKSLRHRVEAGLVSIVRFVIGILPDGLGRFIGTCVGIFFYVVDRSHRRVAIRQIRAAFPTRSEAECRAIARATFTHFGRALVALLKFSTLSPEGMRERIEYEGDDRMMAALARGKGVIISSGHFGFWELQGISHPLRFPPIHIIVRPLDNPYLDRQIDRWRRATGNTMIPRQGAMRRSLRALAANECVVIMIDQHIQPKDAVTVDFFNRPAATTGAVAALALRTGAPIVPVFCVPLPRGRYRMIYEHPVEFPPADSPDPVRELTQRTTDVLEMYVRRHPHLWLWMHRRWRDPESSEADGRGMFPAAARDVEEPGS